MRFFDAAVEIKLGFSRFMELLRIFLITFSRNSLEQLFGIRYGYIMVKVNCVLVGKLYSQRA